jgi:uracil-DNA glycosylase
MGTLMLKLLLVGDKPSKKNKDPNVAFVGTASHKRIQEWLNKILTSKAKILMVNRVDPQFHRTLIHATLNQYKIVALGNEAAQALVEYGIVNFFKLPHPSGKNRKLNNKAFVAAELANCKTWIEGD